MGVYREYRNIEASLIDYIKAQLIVDSWSGISVGKTFTAVEDGELPVIVVQLVTSNLKRREVGASTLEDEEMIIIRTFAKSDGQRLDLAKWLVEKLQDTLTYYAYTITSGVVSNKVDSGVIRILKFTENAKELEGVEGLDARDRFRHKLSFTVKVQTN